MSCHERRIAYEHDTSLEESQYIDDFDGKLTRYCGMSKELRWIWG